MGIEFFVSCLPRLSAPIPSSWCTSLSAQWVSWACTLSRLFEMQFYCQKGVDSTLGWGGRFLTMQFFPFCVAFVCFLKSLVTSHTIIYDLYSVKCRSVCNSHGCLNSELQMEWTYAQECFQMCKYAKICNHRWKKNLHRNMYKCCTCQGRCTEKSDSILQGCKVCIELRQCWCLFEKVPRV